MGHEGCELEDWAGWRNNDRAPWPGRGPITARHSERASKARLKSISTLKSKAQILIGTTGFMVTGSCRTEGLWRCDQVEGVVKPQCPWQLSHGGRAVYNKKDRQLVYSWCLFLILHPHAPWECEFLSKVLAAL